MSYLEYRNFALGFDKAGRTLSLFRVSEKGQLECFLERAEIFIDNIGTHILTTEVYPECTGIPLPDVKFSCPENNFFWEYQIHLSTGGKSSPEIKLHLALHGDKVLLSAIKGSVLLRGVFKNGDDAEQHCFLLNNTSDTEALRCALGPADNPVANMLYNRVTDSALLFCGKTSVHFDWQRKEYVFEGVLQESSRLEFRFEQEVCKNLFQSRHWKSIAHKHSFKTPPVGWMTWYAARFAANEQIVLDNARKMKQLFGAYSDKIYIWVDWEWCHKSMDGLGEEGVDVLHPRKDAYPRGLEYVSDKIKRLGMIPALWSGATCDSNWNEMLKANPEFVLSELVLWPGCIWIDLSHPEVARKYIPRIFRQILDWGYEAIKWDCLVNSLRVNDEWRDKRYDPGISSEEALHRLLVSARQVIGDKTYFLGCTACDRASLAVNDVFDAFRIGGDVFSWKEFKENALNPVFSYYPLHNTQNFLDPDTLVLREKYSTLEQARSRVTFFALTGTQLTVGDPIDKLDAPRIHALRSAMPVAEVHPTEMLRKNVSGETAVTVCTVNRPFGSWYVAGVFNLTEEPRNIQLKLTHTLQIPTGKYAAFEFWKKEFLGIVDTSIDLGTLPAGGCAALRLTKIDNIPLLIGTTRHLLQGAVELENCGFDAATNCLTGKVRVIENDPVELYFYIPEKFAVVPSKNLVSAGRVATLLLSETQSKTLSWQVKFRKNAPE